MSSLFPAIPEPTEDNLLETVQALKQVVDCLTGALALYGAKGVPLAFIQPSRPLVSPPVGASALWVDTSQANKLYFWANDTGWTATT